MLERDCYFYTEIQDMGAHIPTCRRQDNLGVCPCDKCKKFLSQSKAERIIEKYLDDEEKAMMEVSK